MKQGKSIWKKGLATCLMLVMLLGFLPMSAKANTMYDATPIALVEQVRGQFVYGDGQKEQWYSFQTGADGGYYYIEAKNLSTSRTCTFYLLDNFSKKIAYTSVSVSKGEQTTQAKPLAANSTYYIKVAGSPTKTSDVLYEFRVFAITDDASNTVDGAKVIVGDTPVSGSHEIKGDIDFYTFTTGIAGNYIISASNNCGTTKHFTIYNEYNKTVGSLTVPAYETKRLENKVFDANSNYYIKVTGKDEGDYDFRILAPTDDCGNTGDTAEVISLGTETAGVIDYKKDIDFWAFTTGEASAYKIKVTNTGDHSVSVKLLDEGEAKVSFPYSSVSNKAPKEATINLDPNSKYFITVQSGYEFLSYNVLVEAVTDDYPDDWKQAYKMKVGTSVDGVVATKQDSDWFMFTPDKTAKYVLKRTGKGVSFEVYSCMSNGTLKKITSATSKTMQLEKNQTYYVRLYTTSKSTSYNYSFSVKYK